MIQKVILTLDAGKSLKVEFVDGVTRLLPVGQYKVERDGDNILVVEPSKSTEEFTANYRNLLSAIDTPMFGSAEEALTWFRSNFFKSASGGGGGATYTLSVGEQTIVAGSNDQVNFDLTGGATLPADKVNIMVFKHTDKLEQADFTRASNSRITVGTDWKAIVGDRYTIRWVALVSS